ncbi:MAG TPA: DNA-binding transcriptional regulator [Tepidisphaeraceae bacterium]|nr:DNA-binding transcriptional regulator [Tepidisphaeraceae bacterium]
MPPSAVKQIAPARKSPSEHARPPRVALLIETSNAYARGLLDGVTAYLREHRPWSIYLSEHGRGDSVPHWLQGWRGDGILARIENKAIADAVAERNLPSVDLSAARLLPGIPWAETDDALIARNAFQHLRDRGFRHVGFCGLKEYNWSVWRCEHFRKLAAEANCECSVYMVSPRSGRAADWSKDQADLARWLKGLQKPVGVFACFDILGRQVLDACRAARLRVPDDVAVIGVDNDPVLCELSDPPLSSVSPDTRRTGYTAASLLDKLMLGESVPPEAHLIPPMGVVARRSTDALAIEDAEVSAAVRYIREHACDGIGIDQVLEVVPLSRRALESRFRKLLGRTPHEEIVRVQIERARELLTQTDLPLKAIANRLSIPHAEYLNVLFKRVVGEPPGTYRKNFRNASLPTV